MKIRMAIAAVFVASVAASGFGSSALAGACTPLGNNTGGPVASGCTDEVTVEASLRGGDVWLTPVKDFTTLPNAPEVDFLGPATTVAFTDANGNYVSTALFEICISDDTQSGNVYMWVPASGSPASLYDPNLSGSWWALPTFHLPGFDCANSWMPGTFTRN
jgi:hypothetical protein